MKELKKSILDATDAHGFTYADSNDANIKILKDNGYIEVNESEKNADGHVAVRATDKLRNEKPNPEKVKASFAIMSGLAPTPIERKAPVGGGKREEMYPFSQLAEVNASFFVPLAGSKYADQNEQAQKFGSTVASAQRRFAEELTGETRVSRTGETVAKTKFTRKFTVRPVTQGQTYENGFVEPETGIRVYRIA